MLVPTCQREVACHIWLLNSGRRGAGLLATVGLVTSLSLSVCTTCLTYCVFLPIQAGRGPEG